MNNSLLDVIIVGAGQAGLSASHYLKNANLKHIVFERGKIGESWRSQRWHSFKLNSMSRLNLLPGARLNGNDPYAFCTHTDFVASLEKYAIAFQLPVLENVNVISIEKQPGVFKVLVSQHNSVKEYCSKQVIIASGMQNEKKIPAFAKNVSTEIKQLHTSEYRNAAKLPEGAVLVVGSAQSGVQIAEDLIEDGRKVYLSTSMVGRVPRRYCGKDIMDWLLMLGYFDLKTEDVTDHTEFAMKPPQLTGTGGHAHTISLQHLAKKGAVILGRMSGANDKNVLFLPNAKQHVQFADMLSEKIKSMIDAFIQQAQLPAPPAEKDAADMPDLDGSCASSVTELNLNEHNITSIIWTTGFRGNFNYIKLPVLDANDNPKHKNGISPVEGLYFLGFGWLRSRKSGLIHGIKEDAGFITEKVREFSLLRALETPVTT
jgi:putative flavoprotein involved in K+ transport